MNGLVVEILITLLVALGIGAIWALAKPFVETLNIMWRLQLEGRSHHWQAADGFVNPLDIVLSAPYDDAKYTEAMWGRFKSYIDADVSGRFRRILEKLEELRQMKVRDIMREQAELVP